jgi:hypothetical protein
LLLPLSSITILITRKPLRLQTDNDGHSQHIVRPQSFSGGIKRCLFTNINIILRRLTSPGTDISRVSDKGFSRYLAKFPSFFVLF